MNKKGFTMVELLAVLVILPILMLIAVPTVQNYLKKAGNEYYHDLESSLSQSAMDMTADNFQYLPRAVGEYKRITKDQILSYGELERVVDQNQKACSSAYVVIFKKGAGDYQYQGCVTCSGYKTSAAICEKGA